MEARAFSVQPPYSDKQNPFSVYVLHNVTTKHIKEQYLLSSPNTYLSILSSALVFGKYLNEEEHEHGVVWQGLEILLIVHLRSVFL